MFYEKLYEKCGNYMKIYINFLRTLCKNDSDEVSMLIWKILKALLLHI